LPKNNHVENWGVIPVVAWKKIIACLMMLLMLVSCAVAEELPQANGDYLLLASSAQPLAEDYEPEDLVKLASRRSGASTKGTVYTEATTSIQLRQEAADALVEMCAAAEKKDTLLYVRQGYRSYADEAARYARLEKRGEAGQKPGETDYQTGLAVTVVGKDWKSKALTAEFAETKEGKWLAQNAAKYGFVVRYPQNKMEATGWEYEPWHLRYVGVAAATYMQENDLCLEEFVALALPLDELPLPETTPEDEPVAIDDPVEDKAPAAPTAVPVYEEGQLVELEDVGPDGDHEISFFHK